MARPAGRAFSPSDDDLECLICTEPLDISRRTTWVQTSCSHHMCIRCLEETAQHALDTRPFQPVRCCQAIETALLAQTKVFTDEELKQYIAKLEEFTNPQRRIYCHRSECAVYIPKANYKHRIGVCPECGKNTCKSCRKKSHWGPCEKDATQIEDEERVVQLAESKGWKRCPGCLNFVQKKGGCDHIECICGQMFCYACGEPISNLPTAAHRCAKTYS